MNSGNKYLLRCIVAGLLTIYEKFSAEDFSLQDYNNFILELENLFNSYFSDVVFKKYDAGNEDKQQNNFYYKASFSISTEGSSGIELKSRAVMVPYLNAQYVLSLIGGLKKCIEAGFSNILFVSERNTLKRTTFSIENNAVSETDSTCVTSKISQQSDANNDIVSSFFIDLMTIGSLDIYEDFSITTDFFLDSWELLTDFVRSALINYHIAYCNFSAIHICKRCGKIFLLPKSGPQRGIFCSTECKNSLYKSNNKLLINCIQNQKNRLDTMRKYCNSEDCDKLFLNINKPSIDDCRQCFTIRDSLKQASKVGAGKCPILLNDKNFILLTEAYFKQKELSKINKRNKKKLKIYDDDEYHLLL